MLALVGRAHVRDLGWPPIRAALAEKDARGSVGGDGRVITSKQEMNERDDRRKNKGGFASHEFFGALAGMLRERVIRYDVGNRLNLSRRTL